MKPMSEKQLQEWTSIRQRGQFRYVLSCGILRAGLVYATLCSLLNYLLSFRFHGYWHGFPAELFRFALNAIISGTIMSFCVWDEKEKQFLLYERSKREIQSRDTSSGTEASAP